MNEENGEIEEKAAQKKGGNAHPPGSVVHTAESNEGHAESANQERTAPLNHISRWRRFWKWVSTITVAEAGMLFLTLVIAGSSIVYTKYAKRQWNVMNDQLKEMQGASRPWAGIDESGIQVASVPQFVWPTAPTDLPTITLDLAFPIKNFGTSPALHESSAAWVIPIGLSAQQIPTDLVDTLCTFSKGMGDTLLPGAVIHPRQPALYYAGKINGTHLSISWIAVCIKYEDSGHNIHHSKYLYMSAHQPGLNPVQASPSHPDWTYVPVTGLILWNADAD